MAIILVNLSAVFSSNVNKGKHAFAELHKKYASSNCAGCCPGFFNRMASKAVVAWLYLRHRATVFEPYRLGQISTAEFLDKAVNMFSFLKTFHYPNELKQELLNKKARYITQQNSGGNADLDNEVIARLLVEDAFNDIYEFKEEDFQKLRHFIDKAKAGGDSIYFISNSNEINIHRILYEAQQKGIALQGADTATPLLKIAENVFMALSYRYQTYKTPEDNLLPLVSTPTLLEKLLEEPQLGTARDKQNLIVISQYDKDLKQAERLGIAAQNIYTAEEYYRQDLPSPIAEQGAVTEASRLIS